jgi:phosphoglycerol transferase MdoB-like AlkP superfamily enzyme
VAFFFINNGYFPNTGFAGMMKLMGGGLLFDVSAVFYTNIIYFSLFLLPFAYRFNPVFQKVMRFVFLSTNGLALGLNSCDFIYFQFGFRRTTASIMTEFEHESNLGALLPKAIVGYWYVVVIWLVLVAALVLAYGPVHKTGGRLVRGWKSRMIPDASGWITFLVCFVLMIAGIRGTFQLRSEGLNINHAGNYINEPLEANIVLNTPFSVITTISKQTFEKQDHFPDTAKLDSIYSPVHTPVANGPVRRQNVVIFILESFGAEYTRSFGGHLDNGTYRGYTPFLDSLIGNGLMFKQSFSNGRKSVDATPSVLASIPFMEEPFILTPYASNRFDGIGTLLGREGYHTAFFHGAPKGSLGFDTFTKNAGFVEYYGMEEYPNKADFDGSWGVWDEEFFQFFATTMNGFKQPFCTALFSVSSHHPFVVPDRYKGKFKKGPNPILQCISYTDYSLRRFFETASKMPWFENTLFVFTGDHTSQSNYVEYKTNLGAFRVPVIFYKPDGSLRGVEDNLAQQIDIMPSVLGYLNYDKPFLAFGRNLFDPHSEPFAVSFTSGTYQLVMGDYLYLFNGLAGTGLYNFRKDTLLSKNIKGQFPDIEGPMDLKVKAFIQQYNNRMIENRLTAGN